MQSPLKIHADLLRAFWSEHGVVRGVSTSDWENTIASLITLGQVELKFINSKYTLEKKRTTFNKLKNKRRKYRFKGDDLCFACGEQAQVRHHIIWLKNGGRNNKRNICFLCHSCHSEIHPWLKQF